MPRYSNGYVSDDALVEMDSPGHRSTPTTAARFYLLRHNVERDHDVRLYITPGENGYRSIGGQHDARNEMTELGHPDWAATPGFSSHGGSWCDDTFTNGEWIDAMAFDIGNYWALPLETFFAECRKVGFLANAITPERTGGIYEPHHIIDLDPYGPSPLIPNIKGEDMYFGVPKSDVYALTTEIGQPSMRVCGPGEAAIARAGGLVITCDAGTVTMAGKEAGYDIALKRTDAGRRIASAVWNGEVVDRGAEGRKSVLQELANLGTAVRNLLKVSAK